MEWEGTTDESTVEIDLYHCGESCNSSVSMSHQGRKVQLVQPTTFFMF